MARLVPDTFDRAVELLKSNCVEQGIKASTSYYNQVWARDSFITFLGANLLGDELLLRHSRAAIRTFAKTRSPLGQIANQYDLAVNAPEFGYSGSTDSTCWYIIGLASLYAATDDRSLLKEPLEVAVAAYGWLRCQDANNSGLLDSPPGADWMDAAIQRTGKTLYVNALYLCATRSLEKLLSALGAAPYRTSKLDYDVLKQRFTDVFLPGEGSPKRVSAYWPRMGERQARNWPAGFSRRYFLHYIAFSRIDERFDTFSNVLCILSGIAEGSTSRSIVSTMARRAISEPYPSKALSPPYRAEGAAYDRGFDSSLPVQHRSRPYAYHNGGVWPFIGGFYVCALNEMRMEDAPRETESLARANNVFRKDETVGFNEWIHGSTGAALGQFGQSWNAGSFIASVLSAKGKRVLGFLD